LIVVGVISGLVLPSIKCADSHARICTDGQECQWQRDGNVFCCWCWHNVHFTMDGVVWTIGL